MLDENTILDKLAHMSPRVWKRGDKARIYLHYPRPYQGGIGGGDNGYIDLVAGRYVGRTDTVLLGVIKAAIAAAQPNK